MMLWGWQPGDLELRRDRSGEARLRGRFPYGKRAVLSDGGRTGRPRKEVIASRAFSYRVELPNEDIHLLVGHSYDTPLASKATGTLTLRDTIEALIFEARITPELAEVSWVRDTMAAIAAGLTVGISPGFRIPPARAVPDAEEIAEEPDDGTPDENGEPQRGAIIRTVKSALLYEISVVTRPAYSEAQIEMRNWNMAEAVKAPPDATLRRALSRWRV